MVWVNNGRMGIGHRRRVLSYMVKLCRGNGDTKKTTPS